ACVGLGGTISGEHGIGMDKREAMKWLFSRETLSLFRRLKMAFDPNNLCNPDKLIPLIGKTETVGKKESTDDVEQIGGWGGEGPTNEEELIQKVKKWAVEKRPFGIQGSNSKYQVSESE